MKNFRVSEASLTWCLRFWCMLSVLVVAGCSEWEEDVKTYDDSPCQEGSIACLRFVGPFYRGTTNGCVHCEINTSTVTVNIKDANGKIVGTSGQQPWDEFDPNGEAKILCIEGLPGEIRLKFEVLVDCPYTTDQAGVPCGRGSFRSLDNAEATLKCGYRDIFEVPLYGG